MNFSDHISYFSPRSERQEHMQQLSVHYAWHVEIQLAENIIASTRAEMDKSLSEIQGVHSFLL